MKVMKFGGTSVKNAENINKVIDIIEQSLKTDKDIVVVVSAFGGVTDELIKITDFASQKDLRYKKLLKNLTERHNQVIQKLVKIKNRKKVLEIVSKKYKELEKSLENIFSDNKLHKYSLDAVVSFGEQLSSFIINEAMKNRSLFSQFIDIRKYLKTDDNFGEANVDIESSYKLLAKTLKNRKLFVVGGFIGSTKKGLTTTLGRGGSDYTASLVGAALDAEVIEIWTDVDGIMTEDPKKMKDALLIPEITYEKAEEMAHNGAKVIHPKTIKPAVLKNIPIYVKNTFNPKGSGTKISNQKINKKIPVGILGATGMVGQRFISLLKDHPWFEVTVVAASRNSAGKKLGVLTLYSIEDDIEIISKKCRLVFSAVNAEKDFIKKIEEAYAGVGLPVVSNNSAHRWTSDIPMIIPEINSEHLDIIPIQKKNRGWKGGFIVVKPNCSLQSYVPLLHAWKSFVPKEVIVSTYQAISGAGKTFNTWPEMIDNVIPYIGGEEEKSEKEPQKIFGKIKGKGIVLNNTLKISANCIRVPVADGHMASINIKFGKKITKEKLILALKDFKNPLDGLDLPSAPKSFITYFEEENRPQTKLDRELYGGMGISAGRIRKDSVLGWKVVALSHNTIRGAAGGGILTAELLVKKGYIK